jgi:hypothetical protein
MVPVTVTGTIFKLVVDKYKLEEYIEHMNKRTYVNIKE